MALTLIPMNETLLGIIILTQRCRDYYVAKNILLNDCPDWWKQVETLWRDIPTAVFQKAGIANNRMNLEESLRFEVTEEMRNTQSEELDNFKTSAFYPC